MPQLPRLLRLAVSQDVALRNAAGAAAGMRERRRMNEDVEDYLADRGFGQLVMLDPSKPDHNPAESTR